MSASVLRESFSGWLNAVTPTRTRPVSVDPAICTKPRLTIVNGAEFMRVSNATVREGESHCIWPVDVLRKFQRADVIRDSRTTHYELRDVNITQVATGQKNHR